MKLTILTAALLVPLALGSATVLRQQVAAPTPAPAPNAPTWRDVRDIGNGVQMSSVTGFGAVLLDPATGEQVRPISIHVGFLFGVGLMSQLDYLKVHPVADATAMQAVVSLDRNIVVRSRPPAPPLYYDVSIAPKPGKSWGTVSGAADLDFTATPRP